MIVGLDTSIVGTENLRHCLLTGKSNSSEEFPIVLELSKYLSLTLIV